MASLNKVLLIGNLTRDPEVRFTPKGQAVCELGLAVNRRYRLESGEVREEVCFVDVTFWGRQAETIGKWMKKGRPIFVEGRLQMDTWDDKATGQKRSKMRVIGVEFQFLGDGSGRGGQPGDSDGPEEEGRGSSHRSEGESGGGRPAPPQQQSGGGEFPPNLDEDEIPF